MFSSILLSVVSQARKTYDVSKYDRPSAAVDLLIFTVKEDDLKILLVKRGVWPYKGMWALPGGFIRINESIEDAAKRELFEEAGLKDVYLEQLYTFGDPDRDPRTRVIAVSYLALIPSDDIKLLASTDTMDVNWFSLKDLPKLAFDHAKIIKFGFQRLKNKLGYSNIAYGLLADKFRLSQLQKVYEIILGEKLDKRNFRKKMLSLGLLKATGKKEVKGAHRPAMLYRFKTKEIVFIA